MKINRKELLGVLASLRPGLSSKDIIEQSNSFMFCNGTVYCYNDLIAISHPFDVGFEGSVNQTFYEILNKLSEDEVDITINEEKSKVQIKGKSSKSNIVLDSTVKISLDNIQIPKKWNDLPEDFIEAMKTCIFSASRNMTYPILTCLHVTSGFVESCDGARFTRFTFNNGKMNDEILIPVMAADDLVSYGVKKYALSNGWIHFKTSNDTVFSCRVHDGEYKKDLDNRVKVENSKKVEIPKEILPIIDRASVFCEEKFQKDEKIDIAIEKKALTITSQSKNGEHSERTRCSYDGDLISFRISPKFMEDILSKTDSMFVGENKLRFETDKYFHVIVVSM